MSAYLEFEAYLNNGATVCIDSNPVDVMFSIYKVLKKINDCKEITHPYVDWLYNNYNCNSEPKYKVVCTYVFYNSETKYFYIGSGNRQRRERNHLRLLEACRDGKLDNKGNNILHDNWKFQVAYNNNQNFNFFSIILNTRKEALALEQCLIDLYHNTEFNLNIAKYVELGTLGLMLSDSTKSKMSESRLLYLEEHPEVIGQYSEMFSGENNPMFGRKHTEETKDNQSKLKNEWHEKLSEMDKNIWLSNLSMSKMGNTNSLGHIQTEEHRKNIKTSRQKTTSERGYYHSPDTLDKISESNRKTYEALPNEIKESRKERSRINYYSMKNKPSRSGMKNSPAHIAKTRLSTIVAIFIDDTYYESVTLASKILNINITTIVARLKNINFPNYKYADVAASKVALNMHTVP